MSTVAERLDALYAELPKLECQRKCQQSCGALIMGEHEARRIEAATGKPLQETGGKDGLTCPYLDMHSGDCTVREVRPLICRMWGLGDFEMMACPWGCVPERILTTDEMQAFRLRVRAISGGGERNTASEYAHQVVAQQNRVRELMGWRP